MSHNCNRWNSRSRSNSYRQKRRTTRKTYWNIHFSSLVHTFVVIIAVHYRLLLSASLFATSFILSTKKYHCHHFIKIKRPLISTMNRHANCHHSLINSISLSSSSTRYLSSLLQLVSINHDHDINTKKDDSVNCFHIHNVRKISHHSFDTSINSNKINKNKPILSSYFRLSSTTTTTKLNARSSSKSKIPYDLEQMDEGEYLLDNISTTSTRKNSSGGKKAVKKATYRADRVLANRTGRSRSECFQLIKEHRVHQIIMGDDGNQTKKVVISGPSIKIAMNTPLMIDHHIEVPIPSPLLVVYHKPKWVLSVLNDPKYQRPCIVPPHPNMHPVGRLDYDSSGLLLFSSSGTLTQRILHPKSKIDKIYRVTVSGKVDATQLQQQLLHGIETTEGIHTGQLINVSYIEHNDDVKQYLDTVKKAIPYHVYNHTDLQQRGYFDIYDTADVLSIVTVQVCEGKYRMVRRMLANVNHPVIDLHRIQIGPISLHDCSTPSNTTRLLTKQEYEWATSLLASSS